METTHILLTIEFTVLAAALIAMYRKSRANRRQGFGYHVSVRHPKTLPQGLAPKGLRGAPESRKHADTSEPPAFEEVSLGDVDLNCPTPWGWPHYQDSRATRMERPTTSQAMNSLVDCLVREKNLVAAKTSDPRIDTILRALLEERKVPVSAQRPSLAEVQKRVRGETLISR